MRMETDRLCRLFFEHFVLLSASLYDSSFSLWLVHCDDDRPEWTKQQLSHLLFQLPRFYLSSNIPRHKR